MLKEVAVSPEVIIPTETTMLYDVATLINAVYQITLEPTKEGRIPKRLTKKLRPTLKAKVRYDYDDAEIYIDMLILILKTLKIVTFAQPPFEEAKPYLTTGPAFQTWSGENTVAQTRKLLNQWKSNYNWLDVNMFSNDEYNRGVPTIYGRYLLDYRQMLLEEISHCATGPWYSMEAIVKQIWEENPVQIAQLTIRTQFYNYNQRNSKGSNEEKYKTWAQNTAPVFVNMFFSSLLELGIVEIGHASTLEEQQVLFSSCMFRLTELGANVLNEEIKSKSQKKTTQDQEPQKLLIVQPNYEILLMQPDLPTLYSLLPFTQVKQINLVSTLTLTQATLIRGIKNGIRAEEIISLLRKLSQKDLPQNIVYTLQDWGKQYKQASVSQAILLELPTEEVTQQVMKQAALVKMSIRQLAPCLLAIPQKFNGSINLATIRTALEKEGVMAHFIIPPGSKGSEYEDAYEYNI